jgi:hypothetical protein
VIIGIKNRRMWQSLPPPLVSGLGDSGGVLQTTEEEDAACGEGVRRRSVAAECGGVRRRSAACYGGVRRATAACVGVRRWRRRAAAAA